jgi:UDP-N-acetylmuramoylalanine--D-glutamate ligase
MIDIKGKKVLVAGLGVSGFAAAQLAARKGAIVKVTENDDSGEVRDRLKKLEVSELQYEVGGHTAPFCADAELLVTSPGMGSDSFPVAVAREKGIPVVGEMEFAFWFCPAPVIAITGTNGKSTTTELIGRILSSSGLHAPVCGNIGTPLSGVVEELTEKSVVALEVSSFQLETIREFKPRVAVLLNISDDHYERHGSYERYKSEKFRIFSNQDEKDWAVVHSDFRGDPEIKGVRSRVVYFGAGEETIESVIKAEEVPLKGKHNIDNIACSIAVAKIMGSDDENIREAIMTFKGLPHRFERVCTCDDVEFIDDSKATNIDAAKRALESLDKKTILIAGGRDKGGDYASVLPVVKNRVKAVVLIGEAREKMMRAFSGTVDVFEADTMAEAVRQAHMLAEGGDAVMLSPMCSSFDMFSSYTERGEVFQREVKKLFEGAAR